MLFNILKIYWPDLIVILAFIIIMLILIKRGKKEVVSKIIYSLVVRAEKEFGSKTGEIKYAQVFSQIYTKMPLLLRIIFTEKDISKFIEDGVRRLKIKLNNGEFDLQSYESEIKRIE